MSVNRDANRLTKTFGDTHWLVASSLASSQLPVSIHPPPPYSRPESVSHSHCASFVGKGPWLMIGSASGVLTECWGDNSRCGPSVSFLLRREEKIYRDGRQ
jgi:hypothetical protein